MPIRCECAYNYIYIPIYVNEGYIMFGIQIRENIHVDKNLVESHYHKIHQILYVLENKGEIIFNEESHLLTEDSIAFIPPFSTHSIISETKMTILVLEFDLEKIGLEVRDILTEYDLDEAKLIELNLFEAGNVRQLLRRILYEQSQQEADSFFAMKIFLFELLLILLRSGKETNITNANMLRAERLRKYIDTHYFEIVDANDISKNLNISTRYINTIFKEQYSVTPIKYLNEVRMEIAKKLLIETNKDITSICFEIGFESLSTFYRRFKEYVGVSPYKYRLKNKIQESDK